MKKLTVIMMLFASMLLLGGCDLFRKMAGRPTSADIEAKRKMIERYEAARQRTADSIERVRSMVCDSLAVMDSLANAAAPLIESRPISDDSRRTMNCRYYVIIGAFGNRANAEKRASTAASRGYEATLISYRNGFTAVGICPSDNIVTAYSSLKEVREGGFCPDAWILDNR